MAFSVCFQSKWPHALEISAACVCVCVRISVYVFVLLLHVVSVRVNA